MSSSVLSSTTLSTLMKDISEALQLDRNDHFQEAYKKYVECVLKITSKLLLNVRDEGGQVTVTKEVTKFAKLGQQCMERIVVLVQEKLDNPTTIKPGTNLHLTQEKVGSGPGQQKHISSPVDRVVSPDSSQLLSTGVEPRERMKKMSPMELALHQNQQLMNAFQVRQAQSRNKSAYANLSLTLQRKMVENLSVAKAQEEAVSLKLKHNELINMSQAGISPDIFDSIVLAMKMKARQQRLEEQAAKRFNTQVGMSKAEQEQRQVYKKIMEFEQEEIWLLDWRKRLEEDPTNSGIVSKLIQEILRCEDHPLIQQLKIYQQKIYKKLLPIAQQADAIKQVKVPLPDDIYMRILKSEYRHWESSASRESTQKTTKDQSANSKKCMKHSDELNNQSSEVHDEQPACTQGDESKTPTQKDSASRDRFDRVAEIQTKKTTDDMKYTEVDVDHSSDKENSNNNSSGAISPIGEKVCDENDEKKDYSEIYSEVHDDVEKAVYRGEILSSRLEKENYDVKTLVRQISEEYEKYSMENMDDLFENDDEDHEHLNDKPNKDTEIYPDSLTKDEVRKSEVTERKGSKNSDSGMSDESVSKPGNRCISTSCYENLGNKIKVLINEAYHRHLKGITEDVLTYIEKLQVLFIVAYEELDSPMGRDQCNMLIEDAFFRPLWAQLLILFRLAHEPKEIALAHVMTKRLNSLPGDFGVRGKLCLMRESGHDVGSYPYEDAVMELRNIADCHTMLSKLECLVKTSRLVCQCVQEFHKDTNPDAKQSLDIGADDLLPVLCYVVCRSQLPQIVSECHAIENFVHEGYLLGEEGYCLTSIQTAMNFLVTLGMERD